MDRCDHAPALTERDVYGAFRKRCYRCGLETNPHESGAGARAEWKVRLALDKRLHGDALSARDEVVLAYGYHAGAHGQRLV